MGPSQDRKTTEFGEDQVDEAIRQQMSGAFPLRHRSEPTLEQIRPAIVRARRGGQMRAAAGWASAAAIIVGVVAVTASQLRHGDPLVEAGPVNSGEDQQVEQFDTATGSSRGRIGQAPATTAGEGTIAPADRAPSSASSDTTSNLPSSAITSTTHAVSTLTTSEVTPPTTLEGECGVIYYRLEGQVLTLVDTSAPSGVSIDVENFGPEEIEVHFDRPSGSDCEYSVHITDGQVVTETEFDS